MPTTTPNLGLQKPVVGSDTDTWGSFVNASLDTLDAKVFDKTVGGTIAGDVAVTGNFSVSGTVTGTVSLSSSSSGVTQAPGTNNTTLATTAFVTNSAFSAALPAQAGNAGRVISTNGSVASWSAIKTVQGVDVLGAGNIQIPPVPTVEVFSASGTWTVPAGVTRVRVTVVGGGGSGGSSTSQAGAGGGGGGSAIKTLSVTPGQSYTITIGAGGAGIASGGSGSNGNSGGTSTFTGPAGTVSATGGQGGQIVNTAAGGIGSGGDLNIRGGTGTSATGNQSTPAPLGGGTIFSGAVPNGTTPTLGAGSAGIFNNGGSPNAASGVVVLEY